MPDKRKHRGKNPRDDAFFNDETIEKLSAATRDLSMLLTKNYPSKAALKLVGDQFSLNARQRRAVERCADFRRPRPRANSNVTQWKQSDSHP